MPIHASAAAKLRHSSRTLRSRAALVGFDGFIDEILHTVDQRTDADHFTRVRTIGAFAERVSNAAGKSTNLELVLGESRFGGNGPLVANGVISLGIQTSYIGAIGDQARPDQVHPLFREFAARCRHAFPLASPALTHALEFEDGKVMLGRSASIQRVCWQDVMNRVGLERLRRLVAETDLIVLVNWVMMPGAESIWAGLTREVLSGMPSVRTVDGSSVRRRVFVDLCDPAKRSDADLARALGALRDMNAAAPVTLGLNLAEAERVACVVGVSGVEAGPRLARAAEGLRARLGLDAIVVHPREGAAGADATGSAWVDGPYTPTPRLSTGAGDHFNAGFAAARLVDIPLAESLAIACATSGAYVRDAGSPGVERVVEMLGASA